MNGFRYVEPATLQEAAALLMEDPTGTKIIGGGTDLLSEVKDGLESPRRLVSLAAVSGWQSMDRHGADGVRWGAGVTLANLAKDLEAGKDYPAVAQAARSVGTPQIRNVATLGGNLCQRPRCWYYRHPLYPCYKKGGDACYGANGYNRLLAILGGGASVMVHPSDLAPALIASGARAEVYGPNGFRRLPLEEFFAGPQERQLQEHVMEPGELLAAVLLPPPPPHRRSVYLKAQDRAGEGFALAAVAAAVDVRDGVVERADVILGGVAPTPHRARATEACLRGRRVEGLDLGYASELAVEGARPLRHNRYKLALTVNLTRQALESLIS